MKIQSLSRDNFDRFPQSQDWSEKYDFWKVQTFLLFPFSNPSFVRGVSNIPGPIPLTLIFFSAKEIASDLIIIKTAPLEVSYITLFFSAALELEEPIQSMLLFLFFGDIFFAKAFDANM